MIAEPIMGAGGVVVAPPGYFKRCQGVSPHPRPPPPPYPAIHTHSCTPAASSFPPKLINPSTGLLSPAHTHSFKFQTVTSSWPAKAPLPGLETAVFGC
jgi:hypothetical protein